MEIGNNRRTWYTIFILWCLKYGKDYKTEDFDQVKTIPEDEYQELQTRAMFHILNSGRCASCWETIHAAPQICSGDDCGGDPEGEVTVVCPHCKFLYTVSPMERTAEWVDG